MRGTCPFLRFPRQTQGLYCCLLWARSWSFLRYTFFVRERPRGLGVSNPQLLLTEQGFSRMLRGGCNLGDTLPRTGKSNYVDPPAYRAIPQSSFQSGRAPGLYGSVSLSVARRGCSGAGQNGINLQQRVSQPAAIAWPRRHR
jgi:hypothetical protein